MPVLNQIRPKFTDLIVFHGIRARRSGLTSKIQLMGWEPDAGVRSHLRQQTLRTFFETNLQWTANYIKKEELPKMGENLQTHLREKKLFTITILGSAGFVHALLLP